MAQMFTRPLVDHPDYKITLHQKGENPTDKLLITFGGQPSGIAERGFGTDFCLSRGWDTIYVAQRQGSQYQGLPIKTFYEVPESVNLQSSFRDLPIRVKHLAFICD
jgi:hypothetical protein